MTTFRRHLPRPILASVCLGLCCITVFGTGCAGSSPPTRASKPASVEAQAAPAPSTQRIDVTFGGIAVVPLGQTLEPALANRPSSLALDNGVRVDIAWRWANVRLDAPTAIAAQEEDAGARHARAWLGPVAAWTTAATPGESAMGTWLAVLSLSAACDGRSMVLGSRTLHFHVLDPSSRLAAPPDGGAWPHARISVTDPMLAAARSSPVTRWWARLMSDGLRSRITRISAGSDGREDAGAQAPPDVDRFADTTLEIWANQQEERWRWALDAVAAKDRALARQLVERIGLVATVQQTRMPLAAFADPKLEQLCGVLLDPRKDARDRRNAVLAWLENQPASLAWIVDDAGAIAQPQESRPTARSLVSMGVVNLTAAPVVAWGGTLADQSAQDASQVLKRVESQSGTELQVYCDVDSASDLPPGQFPAPVRLAAHIGDDIVMCDAFASPLAVRPPGFVIPGLVADWSAASLIAAARDPAAAPAVDPRTRGLVDRDETGRWGLRLDVADVATVEQVIRVWLGLRRENQTPSAEVRLRPAGLEPLIADGPVETIATRTSDGWVLRFAIPPSEIDQFGVLRLAVERIGPGGRVSWPRPMLPWQMEPGRFGLDLRAWDQVGRGR